MLEKMNLEFQIALLEQNHKKALEIRDNYLNITQSKSNIEHNYFRELVYLLEESNDLEFILKYYNNDKFLENQKQFLRQKIAKLYVTIDYEKSFYYSKDDEIKYLVAKEIAKIDLKQAQILIDDIDRLDFYYGFLVFNLINKNSLKSEIEDLIKDLDISREQKKVTLEDYCNSLIKIAFESFDKFPDISEDILNRFKNSSCSPSDILDLQVLIAVKKSKNDYKNIATFIDEIDDLDFLKAKAILQIVDFFKDDIDKVINNIFEIINKFDNDYIKYNIVYEIQKVTNKNYFKELEELSTNLSFDDDNISFDKQIWFDFLLQKLQIYFN